MRATQRGEGTMLAAAIIVFREVLEAALIVGIVMAATRGTPGSRRWIAAGIGMGVSGAVALAFFAGRLADAFDGSGQELFNAAILSVAVAMLAWHTAWMARHGRAMAGEMAALGRDVASGARPLKVLMVVVGIAVLREGAEVVLFLAGIASAGQTSPLMTLVGVALGLVAGGATGALLYLGLLAIPARALFGATGTLVTLLAAGLAAQATAFLSAAGLLTVGTGPLWDSSHLLSEGSLVGRLLHTLIGYVDHPSLAQVVVWLATIAAITTMTRILAARPMPARA
jgi:high-affinity iron transporter